MNTSENTSPAPEGAHIDRRPLGYWLRAVDGLLTSEFAKAFADEQVDRRDWMLLNAVSGDVKTPEFAHKLLRRGKRLRALADRDWVVETDGTWELTDEGREAKARLGAIVDGIRSRVTDAVSPEDYATTMASLEAIAREFGWDESDPRAGRGRFGRGRFGRRGFGPGFGAGHGFGPGDGFGSRHGHGFGPRGGFGPGHRFDERSGFTPDGETPAHASAPHHEGFRPGGGRCDGEHGGRGRHARHRHGQQAYERGFDAGFARGRDTQDA